MSIKDVFETHGNAACVSDRAPYGCAVDHSPSGAIFGPKNRESYVTDWITIPLTIPTRLQFDQIKIRGVMIRFACHESARIDGIHVYQGDQPIMQLDGLDYGGESQRTEMIQFPSPNTHVPLDHGVGISLHVSLYPRTWIRISSAGVFSMTGVE
jgi:hypothetical protein